VLTSDLLWSWNQVVLGDGHERADLAEVELVGVVSMSALRTDRCNDAVAHGMIDQDISRA
jgi:hypothetical protein